MPGMTGCTCSYTPIHVGLSNGMADHTSFFHDAFAFDDGERVCRTLDRSGMIFFSVGYLCGSEPFRSGHGGPCRSAMSTSQELAIFSGMALTTIQSRELPGEREPLMIQFFPHAWFCLFDPLPPGASGKRTNACTICQTLRSRPLFMGGWGLGFGCWRLGLLVGRS